MKRRELLTLFALTPIAAAIPLAFKEESETRISFEDIQAVARIMDEQAVPNPNYIRVNPKSYAKLQELWG